MKYEIFKDIYVSKIEYNENKRLYKKPIKLIDKCVGIKDITNTIIFADDKKMKTNVTKLKLKLKNKYLNNEAFKILCSSSALGFRTKNKNGMYNFYWFYEVRIHEYSIEEDDIIELNCLVINGEFIEMPENNYKNKELFKVDKINNIINWFKQVVL